MQSKKVILLQIMLGGICIGLGVALLIYTNWIGGLCSLLSGCMGVSMGAFNLGRITP